jgi:N-acetylglucosaminyldiphosphoundecaprenol N-acetyl-beta-D-mannosaminyltransferase
MQSKSTQQVNVGGIVFDNVTMEEAIASMDNRIATWPRDHASLLLVANQDIINRVNSIPDLDLDQLNEGFLTIADGYSIIVAAKILKSPLKERFTGPDLMMNFIIHAVDKGYSHFFLGAREGVGQAMADRILSRHPRVKITGIYSPPFGEFSDEENDKIIEMVNKSRCDVLWVSFGCPKQERWIVQHAHRLKVPIAAGVGAAFDFHSGAVKRAPLWMQKARLEWFYRVLTEPFRLFGRYFVGGFKFLRTIVKQKSGKN